MGIPIPQQRAITTRAATGAPWRTAGEGEPAMISGVVHPNPMGRSLQLDVTTSYLVTVPDNNMGLEPGNYPPGTPVEAMMLNSKGSRASPRITGAAAQSQVYKLPHTKAAPTDHQDVRPAVSALVKQIEHKERQKDNKLPIKGRLREAPAMPPIGEDLTFASGLRVGVRDQTPKPSGNGSKTEAQGVQRTPAIHSTPAVKNMAKGDHARHLFSGGPNITAIPAPHDTGKEEELDPNYSISMSVWDTFGKDEGRASSTRLEEITNATVHDEQKKGTKEGKRTELSNKDSNSTTIKEDHSKSKLCEFLEEKERDEKRIVKKDDKINEKSSLEEFFDKVEPNQSLQDSEKSKLDEFFDKVEGGSDQPKRKKANNKSVNNTDSNNT